MRSNPNTIALAVTVKSELHIRSLQKHKQINKIPMQKLNIPEQLEDFQAFLQLSWHFLSDTCGRPWQSSQGGSENRKSVRYKITVLNYIWKYPIFVLLKSLRT